MNSSSFFQIGSSPLSARASFPAGIYVLGVVIVAAITMGIWLLTKRLIAYKKSDAYIQKQLSKLTTYNDIKKFTDDYRLPPEESNMLWNMCKQLKIPNINYYIKDTEALSAKFKEYYYFIKEKNFSAADINTFFELDFNVEKITAQSKSLLSSKQFPIDSVVFYLTHESEQFPFYVKINNNDFFALELPKFVFDNPNLKPPLLQRLRFITKSSNGMTYHFTSRAMRYQNNPDGKIYLILAHSEDLLNQAHRNSKRETIDAECFFSPAHLSHDPNKSSKGKKNATEEFVINPKEYSGKVTNISSGGCCIKTNLPIKEKQYLALRIPTLDIDEHAIGIIRKTRKLIDENYNLHIQFLQISTESKNRINAYAFKYEI